VGRLKSIMGLAAIAIASLAVDLATAQDKTWKDCELADREPDRSIAACSKLLAGSSSRVHAAAFHNRGLAFAANGNLDQAVSDISQGIRLDPQRAYRWQERGEIYTRQGKYQQAIADITEAIRRDPTPRPFRFHTRAEAYRGLGDLPRAIADFDEAIRLDPVPRTFRFQDRGNALRDAGQYDRALSDYETALKLAPTDAWILLDRGRAYARMGRSQAAKTDFDAALRLDPSNQELRRAIEVELAVVANAPSTTPPAQGAPQLPPPRDAVPAPPPRQAIPAPPSEHSSGSGFVVSRQGHLLTNNHVVAGCALVEIGGVGAAAVVSRDSGNDLALIQAKTQSGLELSPLKQRSKPTRLGEEVIALGYPLRGVLGDGLNVTTGTISALSGVGNDSTLLQFTAAIQPGNSGGPLVDRAGAIVGVVASKFSDTIALKVAKFVPQGVNFAIRREVASAFLESQGISLESMDGDTYVSVADVAQQARKSVLPIICRK
jgi:S1-C subfamily serine protease